MGFALGLSCVTGGMQRQLLRAMAATSVISEKRLSPETHVALLVSCSLRVLKEILLQRGQRARLQNPGESAESKRRNQRMLAQHFGLLFSEVV